MFKPKDNFHPNSSVDRTPASGVGGHGFESVSTIPKVKNGTSRSRDDAHIKRGCARKIE